MDLPLTYAARLGRINVVQWMIKGGFVSVNQSTERGVSALRAAIEEGHTELVQWLISSAHASLKVESYNTALDAAACHGRLQIVAFLIDQNLIEINQSDQNGWTALTFAAKSGHLDVVKYLASKGAHVNTGTRQTDSPVAVAIKEDHLNIVQYLVCQCKASTKDIAVFALNWERLKILRWLTEAKIATDSYGRALCVAIAADQLKIARWLIRSGANVETTENGDTCLMAVKKGSLAMVKLLLSKGHANIDRVDFSGCWSALTASIDAGHYEITRHLIRAGASVNPEIVGQDPVAVAVRQGCVALVHLLVSEGHASLTNQTAEGTSILSLACSAGNLDVVKFLVTGGYVDVDEISRNGDTALDCAIEHDRLEEVQWLVTEGRAQVNISVRVSTLQRSLSTGNSKIMSILILAGAKFDRYLNVGQIEKGVIRAALDKARLKKIRQAVSPLGLDRVLTSLVGRYSMVQFKEAKDFLVQISPKVHPSGVHYASDSSSDSDSSSEADD